MANTRTAAKRARQSLLKKERNTVIKSTLKTILKKALESIEKKDAESNVKYMDAVKALGKAATKRVIPRARASRKIGRLTLFAKKNCPDALKPVIARAKTKTAATKKPAAPAQA